MIAVNPTSTIASVVVSCNPSVLQLPIPNAAYPNSQCTATVQGTGNFDSTVTWQSSPGSIGGTSGVYTPPRLRSNHRDHYATSAQDPTKSGSTTITINPVSGNCPSEVKPAVLLSPPAVGASQLYGLACNVDTTKIKVVIYALTINGMSSPSPMPHSRVSQTTDHGPLATFPWDVLVVLFGRPDELHAASNKYHGPSA